MRKDQPTRISSLDAPADPSTVLRALALMRSQTSEPLTLNDLADAAYSSPYHFLRTFSRATGLSPGRFLAALRLQTAVRLLLTTDLPVTEVCFASGYNSLGTFTRRFTEVIGLPPGRLRQGVARPDLAPRPGPPPLARAAGGATVRGRLLAGPEGAAVARLLFVGLFTASYPQGTPVACALLEVPGPFALRGVADGTYHLLGAGLADPADLWPSVLCDHPDLLAGSLKTPVVVAAGEVEGPTELTLRPPRPTDPPLLACLPLLLSRRSPIEQSGRSGRGAPPVLSEVNLERSR